ncbi:MAG: hypothetical protein KJ057_14955 [Phycisphaerae bacterium]|nr:MAG: hypothetical protein EDS66_09640 [Planctomycetota bacterium]KAB2949181.1 MAG: hypothetical protein F9K17_03850 [Phycisphaerae bacterium]MBE7458697.1 hypothetical protein [Planctomycetia bacterium]MCK6466019.1 exo-alpha-sialidase [Phycisphaerae bacterium]MCL4719767.1 hypothetical protein [Phycisphaerae bacterium]
MRGLCRSVILVGLCAQRLPAQDTGETSAEFRSVAPDLRIIISPDTTTFDEGRTFVQEACAPDLVRLGDGRLVATFDVLTGSHGVPWSATSDDEGRTWSAPAPLRLEGATHLIHPRHFDGVVGANGAIRAFFISGERAESGTSGGQPGGPAFLTIRSALSRDGVHYRVDPAIAVRIPAGGDRHPTAAICRDRLWLFVDAVRPHDESGDHQPSTLAGFLSTDGRRYLRFSPSVDRGTSFVGDLTGADGILEAWVTRNERLRKLTSTDGRHWRESPVRASIAILDAAVAPLSGKRCILLTCTPAGAVEDKFPVVLALSQERRREVDAAWRRTDAKAEISHAAARTVSGDSVAEKGAAGGSDLAQVALEPDLVRIADERVPSVVSREAPTDDLTRADEELMTADGFPGATPPEPGGDGEAFADPSLTTVAQGPFAPVPDFVEFVDYLAWYRGSVRGDTTDDANAAYAAFIEQPNETPGTKPPWPDLKNMFTDESPPPYPSPWSPQDHPEWEDSYQASKWLKDMFRDATLRAGYISPSEPAPLDPSDPDDRPLLLGILLPNLSGHRALAKAVIADGWRAGNGAPDPQNMIGSWETVLRGAAHLQQGSTLIEELVGVAEQSLVQENARWALAQGVFDSPQEIEQALGTLERFDRYDRDPAQSVRGEHAMAMDTTQYLFWPDEPHGPPAPIPSRVDKLKGLTGGEDEEGGVEDIANMTAEDVRATVDAFDQYYRTLADQMRIGYPLVRAADVEAVSETIAHTSPVTRMLTPSLGRYYKLRARSESSRRATQLAYAAHLFHAREGRWPASLDELPEKYRDRVRTDPFTGADFGYRVTADGPRIYSMSENAIDDGGEHSPRWDDGVEPGASDDYVFWPPQVRP